ncbi:TMEM43 family protein [Candidatus Parabeggiatoa sp. HSG14]|uniref:TMEM43 family protein n=1 Tax=Candidatus Parabeggiatoa sp. HSG14 TaxID=3055593 RepID=UPI0025A6AD83|nr:TMEM43 family protein [Thiotrichales bacterium HSG14]
MLFKKIRESRMVAVLLTPIGLFLGLFLCFIAVRELVLNENIAVHHAKTLAEGENVVIPIDVFRQRTNEGQLVHVSAYPMVDGARRDELFEIVAVNAIKLRRVVEMYQWQTEQFKGYDTNYYQLWSDQVIDSNEFELSTKYHNPPQLITEKIFIAQQVKLGDFMLSTNLIEKMNAYQKFPIIDSSFWQVQENLRPILQNKKLHFEDGSYYIGDNPDHPQIGDLRISFEIIQPEIMSIIAKQVNSNLMPYQTQTGDEIEFFEYGAMSAEQMFENEKISLFFNKIYYNFTGFIMIFLGFYSLFFVLWIAKTTIPFMGNSSDLVGWLTCLIIAAVLTLTITGFIWMDYSSITGKILVAIALTPLYFLKFVRKPSTSKLAFLPELLPERIVPKKNNGV